MVLLKGGEFMEAQLEERITNHDTYTKIESIIELVDTIISSENNSEQVQQLERLSETFNILKVALDRADPWLLSPVSLGNMNNHITQILNELTNYNNNNNVQHLNNANSHIDNVIPFFSQVMVTSTPEDIEDIRSSVISFRKSVGQHLSNVERKAIETSTAITNNNGKLNELTTSIESQKTRLDSIISDFQDKFSNGQTERNEKTEQLIEQTKSEFNEFISISGKTLDEQITSQQEKYNSQTEAQEKEFDEQINKQQEEYNSQINKNEIEFDEQVAHQEKGFIEVFDKMKEMNKEAEKILGLMSMKGMAQGYQKIANDEGKKAFRWSMGSVASMLIVIGLAIGFILLHEGTITWTDIVSRLVLTGVGITLFTYCAKQATNYRTEERRNRKIELELASLDPYLKDMEDSEQKKVKESLVNKYFGVELPNPNGQQQQPQQQNVVDAIANNPQFIQLLSEKISKQMSQNQ